MQELRPSSRLDHCEGEAPHPKHMEKAPQSELLEALDVSTADETTTEMLDNKPETETKPERTRRVTFAADLPHRKRTDAMGNEVLFKYLHSAQRPDRKQKKPAPFRPGPGDIGLDVIMEASPLGAHKGVDEGKFGQKVQIEPSREQTSLLTEALRRYDQEIGDLDDSLLETVRVCLERQSEISEWQMAALQVLSKEGEKTRIPVYIQPGESDAGRGADPDAATPSHGFFAEL